MSLDRLFVEVGVYVLTADDRILKKRTDKKRYKSEVEVKTKKIPNNWWFEHLLLRKVFTEGVNIHKKEEYLQDSGKGEENAVIEWKRYKL